MLKIRNLYLPQNRLEFSLRLTLAIMLWQFFVDDRDHVQGLHPPPMPPLDLRDFLNRPVASHLPPEQRAVTRAAFTALRRTGQPQRYDVDVPRLGSRWRVEIWPLPDGRFGGCVVGAARPWPEALQQLTEAQRRICRLLAAGMSAKAIARELNVSPSTVYNHRAKIAAKLRVKPHRLATWCGENADWLE